MTSLCSANHQAIEDHSFAPSTSTLSHKESKMLNRIPQSVKITLSVIMLVFALAAIPSASNAQRFHGACGGGTTLTDFIAGAKAHGVLDDLARKTGQTLVTDGSAEKIVKDNYVRVIVTHGVWVTNYTCTGSSFKQLGKKKYLPKGTVLWVPAKNAPSPGKTKYLSWAAQENCGNAASGKIPVRRPGHAPSGKKPSKKKQSKKVPSAPSNGAPCSGQPYVVVNQQLICQSQQQDQKNQTEQNGSTNGQGSPVINNNITVQNQNANQNGNENNNSSNSGGNNQQQGQTQEQQQIQACALANGQWNTVTHNCDHPTPPPPGCTSNCNPHNCPSGQTWDNNKQMCVKDGSTNPPDQGCTSGCTNPPDDNPAWAQCYWDNAGWYGGKWHDSNGPVTADDWAYAGNAQPVGSSCQ